MEGVGLVTGFQFLLGLAAVFAEEVGDFFFWRLGFWLNPKVLPWRDLVVFQKKKSLHSHPHH